LSNWVKKKLFFGSSDRRMASLLSDAKRPRRWRGRPVQAMNIRAAL